MNRSQRTIFGCAWWTHCQQREVPNHDLTPIADQDEEASRDFLSTWDIRAEFAF
jgi:hypothetical protein